MIIRKIGIIADPHPGNIFILLDNVICYLDFGMMGRISRKSREDFVDMVVSSIGLSGFLVAGVMGFWLLVSILRRGKM